MHKSDLEGSSDQPKASQPTPKYEFVVRFVGPQSDVVVPVPDDMGLADVSTRYIRQQIRKKDPQFATKRLKLIHNGRMLMNHTNFEKEMRFYTADESTEGPTKIYIHCMVGDDLTAAELAKEEEMEKQPEKTTTEAPRGFDRLLSQGFSRRDIEDLRREFQEIHGAYLNSQHGADLRDLEDRWIDSTVNNEIDEFPANLRRAAGAGGNGAADTPGDIGGGFVTREDNVHKELFLGVCVGFFLGVFSLFLMTMDIGGVFNKRTKMAVVSGVIVNLSFGVLKAWS